MMLLTRLLVVLAVVAAFPRIGVAQVIVGSWNIQTLATNGVVFPGDYQRNDADFALLRTARDKLGADVLALEEVTSPHAVSKVFPLAEYVICFSGQYDADAAGLAPHYPPSQLGGIKPTCFDNQPTLPDPPAGTPRKQYVAIVIRRASGVAVEAVADVPGLGLAVEEKNDTTDLMEIRNVRWGLEATLRKATTRFRLLAVHLKSGCTLGALLRNRWDDPSWVWAPDGRNDHACMTLARQMRPLRAWIAQAKSGGIAFIIAGDFNRRIDVEEADPMSPDLWPIVTGQATAEPGDDIALARVPQGNLSRKACWPEDDGSDLRNAIDYLIFSPGLRPSTWESTYRKARYSELTNPDTGQHLTKAADAKRMSDHCPIAVRLD